MNFTYRALKALLNQIEDNSPALDQPVMVGMMRGITSADSLRYEVAESNQHLLIIDTIREIQ